MFKRIKFVFAWYDFTIGFHWDREHRRLMVSPLPMCVIQIDCTPHLEIRCPACGKGRYTDGTVKHKRNCRFAALLKREAAERAASHA